MSCMSGGRPPECMGAASLGAHACTCPSRKRASTSENRVLLEMARMLRSYGWKLTPPRATVEDAREDGLPCPTCGAAFTPSASDSAMRLATAGEVTAKSLSDAAGCTVETAANVLSELSIYGRIVRIGRGRYRAAESEDA